MTIGVDYIMVESADETRIHTSIFPTVAPVAGLFALHGLQGHAGWLEASNTGFYFADHSILTLAYDRRGSGRSAGRRGHAENRRVFFQDLKVALDLLRHELVGRRNPNAPVHVMANCFGARIALAYLLENPGSFDSVILTAPGTHMTPKGEYQFLDRLKILTSPGEKRFDCRREDADYVEPGVWLDWVRTDERALRVCSASFLRAAGRLNTAARQALDRLEVPMLVLTSKDDPLVRNETLRKSLEKRYKGALKLRELNGTHHLDFSSAQAEFRTAVTAWIMGGWSAP